jgi:hypothetical protein
MPMVVMPFMPMVFMTVMVKILTVRFCFVTHNKFCL